MNKNKIVILDMDGTLYDLNDVVLSNYEMQVSFLMLKTKKSRDKIVSFLNEHSIYPQIKKDSKSATELFSIMGYNVQDWIDYREKHFEVSAIIIEKSVKDSVLKGFSDCCNLVLLSSNSYNNIKKVLSHIGCSLSHFSNIICSDTFTKGEPFNKRKAMQFISRNYSIPFEGIISIGDRYKTDIEPMLELGGKGVLLKAPQFLYRVLEDYRSDSLMTCMEYEYFDSL